MKRFLSVTALVGALLPPLAAWSDEASHRKAAEELLETMAMDALLARSTEQLFALHLEQNPQLGPYGDTVRQFFDRHLGWESLQAEFTELYVEEFSEEELREMTAFYRTATGQKAAQKLPRLMARGAEIAGERIQRNLPELERMMADRAREIEAEENR